MIAAGYHTRQLTIIADTQRQPRYNRRGLASLSRPALNKPSELQSLATAATNSKVWRLCPRQLHSLSQDAGDWMLTIIVADFA